MENAFETALGLYRAGRGAEAVAMLRALADHRPGEPAVLNLLGVCLHAAGQTDEAGTALRAALALAPDHAEALLNLAALRNGAGRRSAAAACLRRLLVLDPGLRDGLRLLGATLSEMGDLDGAEAVLRRVARLVPDGIEERFNLAATLCQTGAPDRAIRALRQAIALRPEGAFAYGLLGACCLRAGDLDAAEAAYARALRLDPAAADARHGRVRVARYRATARAARSGAGPDGLALRGAFATASGYSHMARRLIEALRRRRIPLEILGLLADERWPFEPLDRPVRARALLNVLIPMAVERVPGLPTVTFTMFEGHPIPPSWLVHSRSSDVVVVPTRASRRAWIARGFPEARLRLCPLGIDPESGDGAPLHLTLPDGRPVAEIPYRFLNVSDFIPRKNVDGLLRVWLRATDRRDPACLILKLAIGGRPHGRTELADLVRRGEAATGRRLAQAAPILLVDAVLDEARMNGLYRAATHYWSLSHGEGWDLPMATAGALGLGLIAPRHTAYLDYLHDGIAHLIPAGTAPATRPYEDEPWAPFHGLDWWQPDEEAAVAALQAVIRKGAALPSAADHLRRHFTWDQSAATLLTILGGLGLAPRPEGA
ncbi:tetratricopeptide repeat protein [Methylobacterium sp. ID0610]|uniref:tetratricopeptide repeat protein n=1 Tax=Methylobacterium carpenticola TaxID=3344827 RepID=UPI003675CA2F